MASNADRLEHRVIRWGLACAAWVVAAVLALFGAALLSSAWLTGSYVVVGILCLVAAFLLCWGGGLMVSKMCWGRWADRKMRA